MQAHGRAIGVRRYHRDLELAWQVHEFRMEARPLSQQFRVRPWIDKLVRRCACEMIGTDIADAVPAGLDRVHLDSRQIGHQVGRVLQLDPVVLDILAGGEVAVAPVILVRDIGQNMHLRTGQCAIRDGDAQHIGVELQIKPVHQPQRLELVFGQLAGKAAFHLIAKFVHTGVDHLLVIRIIFIHKIRSPSRWLGGRQVSKSGRAALWGQGREPGP